MSCTSTPGNRAVLILARCQAEAVAGKVVAESAIQRAFHSLQREGREYAFPLPKPESVEEWFFAQEEYARESIPVSRSREAALRNLAEAREVWRADPESVTGEMFHAWRFSGDYAGYTVGRTHIDNPVTVAFDCDGVLYSFNDTLKDWLLTRGWDVEDLPDPSVYSLKDAWGLSNGTLLREMPEAVKAGELWNTGASFPDGVGMARQLGLAGHQIMVNTARLLEGFEKEAAAATVTWLRAEGVHPDILHLADPNDENDKMRVPFDVLFDDHPKNVEQAIQAGRQAYIVDRPWNQGVDSSPRVTFDQVPRIVEALQRQR